MADVSLAVRHGAGGFVKLVVIKELRASSLDTNTVQMFCDEARITARLNHPNVVHIHEVIVGSGEYLLEMEYLDGQPLNRIMTRLRKLDRPVSLANAATIMRGVLAGLHYAHELPDYDGSPLSIVHRDVSPSNIFVTYDGRVKIVDFGIAKAAGQATVTAVGSVKGKARYMAPEQASGQPVDRRVDVYAAGIVLWELLTGEKYWGDKNELGIYHALLAGPSPRSARQVNPGVRQAVDDVVMKALAAAPADRFATAQEFLRALEAHLPPVRSEGRLLGEQVAQLFRDERQKLKVTIEAAMKLSAGRASAPEPDELVPRRLSMDSISPTPQSQSQSSSGADAALGIPPTTSVSTSIPGYTDSVSPRSSPRPASQARAFILPVIVGAAIAVLAVGFVARRGTFDTEVPRTGSATPLESSVESGPRIEPPGPAATPPLEERRDAGASVNARTPGQPATLPTTHRINKPGPAPSADVAPASSVTAQPAPAAPTPPKADSPARTPDGVMVAPPLNRGERPKVDDTDPWK